MTNFSDMISKAKAMQEKMKEAQDQIKKIEVEGEAGGNIVKVKLSGDDNISKFEITSFQNLISKANQEKEIELKYDLERNVKLVSFNRGKIDISFNEKLNKNFIKNLTEKLLQWTGERWIISLSKNTDAKSIYEKNLENNRDKIEEFKKSEVSERIQTMFPDAKLINIIDED